MDLIRRLVDTDSFPGMMPDRSRGGVDPTRCSSHSRILDSTVTYGVARWHCPPFLRALSLTKDC